MKKRIFTGMLTAGLVLGLTVPTFAAQTGLYVGGNYYSTSYLGSLSVPQRAAILSDTVANPNGSYAVINDKYAYFKDYKGLASLQPNADSVVPGQVTDVSTGQLVDSKTGEEVTEGDFQVESVSAINMTTLTVSLSSEVDAVSATNFSIPGMNVISATLAENNKDVKVKVSGAVANQAYTLTASGLKIDAEAQGDITYNFTMSSLGAIAQTTISAPEGITKLKADGASSTLMTFKILDANGDLIVDAGDVEVAFATTFGNFAEQRVTVQNGVATNMLNSEFLTVDRTAELTATIVEASDQSLIGKKAQLDILMTPNPDAGDEENIGASLTDAEASQADRVIVYFNRDVDVADYVADDTVADYDNTKAAITVRTGSTSSITGTAKGVVGLLPVAGNSKALQVLLDVENGDFLNDNDNVWVEFIDKTGTVDVQRAATFKLTDARKPAMLSVAPQGLKEVKVAFSEPVDETTSEIAANYSINGKLINNVAWGTAAGSGAVADIEVGEFNPITGVDLRNVVTITLGKNSAGKQIYFAAGNYSVQAANVGDWAVSTDSNNTMNTQTLDFTIDPDSTAPTATVEIQSPEQWLVTFNKDVDETAAQFLTKLTLEKLNKTTNVWATDANVDDVLEQGNVAQVAAIADANLDLIVTKIDDNKFLVETDRDWTQVYSTSTTNKNYYNDSYRLKIAANAVTNPANGTGNAEALLTLDGKMLTADTTSPVIVVDGITEVVSGLFNVYDVEMSEPVKLPNQNLEGNTLSQTQGTIPTPTAQFIKKDNSITLDAVVHTAFVDEFNKVLRVHPVDNTNTQIDLTPGEWTLVVRSISDDIGNTAASATKDFIVEGSAPVDSDFELLWAFADVDGPNGEYDPDGNETVADADANYDYVLAKFSQPIAMTGDFSNVLKTSNYTINGEALPNGSQILADIAGYDDLDNVVDSITIRLPQGTLDDKNSPHVINLSAFLENKDGDLLVNPGEKVLVFDNDSIAWGADFETDFAADLGARALVDTAQVSADAILDDGFDAGEVTAFEADWDAAKDAVDGLDASSLVKAIYEAELDDMIDDIMGHDDFSFVVTESADPVVGATVGAIDEANDFSVKLWDTTTDRYTVAISDDDAYGVNVTFTSGTGTISLANDLGTDDDATYTQTLTITDAFWGESDTVTITITDGVGVDTIVVNAD